MIAKNFDQTIIEIEKMLNLYKKFNLSLIGKVNVIKTLALPKLVYLFTVLPNPDNSTWVKTRKIFKDFLWGEGQVKIVNKQLEKTIEEGGLKLMNIDLFNKALKLSWIRRLITTSGNWQNIFISDIYAHKKLMWELDQHTLDRIQSETANPFWKNIINIWKEFKESFQGEIDPQTYPIQVLDCKNNSNLTKEIPRLVNKGIRHISDLLSNTEGLYGYQEFKQTYNVDLNFVDFYSLTHQIPRKWGLSSARKINKESVKQKVLEDILIVTKVCKFVYHKMIGALEFERGHEEKWKTAINLEIDQPRWKIFYNNNYESCIESSLRAFKYSILLRTLPTNKYLFKCKLIETQVCYFCEITTESIQHLFWYCPVVKNVIFGVYEKLEVTQDELKDIGLVEFLLGGMNGHNKTSLNCLFTLMQKYIFVTKSRSSVLCFNSFIRYL